MKLNDICNLFANIRQISEDININLSPSIYGPWQISNEQMLDLVNKKLVDRLFVDDEQFEGYFGKELHNNLINKALNQDQKKLFERLEVTITRGRKSVFVINNSGDVSE